MSFFVFRLKSKIGFSKKRVYSFFALISNFILDLPKNTFLTICQFSDTDICFCCPWGAQWGPIGAHGTPYNMGLMSWGPRWGGPAVQRSDPFRSQWKRGPLGGPWMPAGTPWGGGGGRGEIEQKLRQKIWKSSKSHFWANPI